jgi:two-component system sensor kinase FixL
MPKETKMNNVEVEKERGGILNPAMRLMRNMAIKQKLMMIIMLTCMSSLILAGAVFLIWEWATLRQDMVRDLSTQAEMIADNCKAALAFEDAKDAEEILSALRIEPSNILACLYNKSGEVFAGYYRNDVDHTARPASLLESGHLFSEGTLVVFRPVVLDGETLGTVCLQSDLQPMYTRLERNVQIITAVLALASLAAYLLSSRIQQIISAPILNLADVAKTVSEEKEYSTRAIKHSNDEVGLLIDSFNGMLGQIQERDSALVSANEKLETRVQERTSELTATNEQLTREIAYRKKAEEVLKKRTEQIIHHQSTLLELGKIATSDLASIMRATTEQDAKTLDIERVSIWLFGVEKSELVCQDLYKRSEDSHEKGLRMKAEDCPRYCQALEASRIVAAEDANKDPRTNEFAEEYLQSEGITSMMDVPLRLHGELVGVVCHEHTGSTREWTLEEQDFAASIADMITLKLEASERRKAEQALRESEHRYRTLLKNIPQKIFYKDRDSVYLLCNESYAEDLKINVDEVKGKTDYDFHPKELANAYRADDARIMALGIPEEIEEKYVKDGQNLIIRTLKSPVRDEQDNIIGIFGIFWDITARKQTEQALERLNKNLETTVQELTRSNKELQDFAYVIAHDLKAPLRAIGTLADWIVTDYSDKFDEQGKDQMRLLKGRVARMSGLIDSILQYSEIGRSPKHLEKLNLNTLIADAIAEIDPPGNIEIVIENELPVVIFERIRLMQVFQNLVGNAITYMDKPQGKIRIGCVEESNFWKFSIADNGPGIGEQYFEKIFKMFQTLVSRDEFESIGIGLAMVKKIVELYGGSVWVESKVSEGSTFFFTLPKHDIGAKDAEFEANIVAGR